MDTFKERVRALQAAEKGRVLPPIPKPVLKDGWIYSADNGMLICLKCAGMAAKYTGHDLSGQKVTRVPRRDNIQWRRLTGSDLSCERGCTSYGR